MSEPFCANQNHKPRTNPKPTMRYYHEKDADLSVLKDKTVAVIGYGSQGRAQALCLKASGVDVIVGARPGKSHDKAQEDNQKVFSIPEAAKKADIIMILLPDENHQEVYDKDIKPNLTKGNSLCFAHGFSITFKQIQPPRDVDVVMVSPRGPGPAIWKLYQEGRGVISSIAVHQDATGNALKTALALAKACGLLRICGMECTFEQETHGDLFGEQMVLVGGVSELIKRAFETITETGYPKEMAYLDCLHELKLLVDLINEHGIEGMYDIVSTTAEFGGRLNGPRILNQEVKQNMEAVLEDIKSGKFASQWIEDYKAGMPKLKLLREQQKSHPIEPVGKRLREMMRKDD